MDADQGENQQARLLLNYKGLDYRTEWVGTDQPACLTSPSTIPFSQTPSQVEYPDIKPRLENQSVPPFPPLSSGDFHPVPPPSLHPIPRSGI